MKGEAGDAGLPDEVPERMEQLFLSPGPRRKGQLQGTEDVLSLGCMESGVFQGNVLGKGLGYNWTDG